MVKRKQDMEAAEQAAVMQEIETEYNKENERVLTQKKALAE